VSTFDGRDYQARIDALADTGVDVHGEARLIRSFNPASVLDAGCGTGRVAIELARHGIDTVGVDVDGSMIAEAKRQSPELAWILSDLATLALGRSFDLVVLAGNVPLFCPIDARPSLVGACAAHVRPGGTMIAGFQLGRGYELSDYDVACNDAGLSFVERLATWDGEHFASNSSYAVSIHTR
jgi:2-polyprenyl-3-methyl-5-hydroxy-6-metoxy-1,4-benzoquinol methylase